MIRGKEAAEKWAKALDLRYHGKSFVRRLAAGEGKITTWQSLKIAVALFLWNRATKKDPWGELYRITKFAQKRKEGDSI